MAKSLIGRCIRRWEVKFKPVCDSKISPHWRKHHLRGYIRECGITTAHCMLEAMAHANAKVDYGITGWSHEFATWYDVRREKYQREALEFLNTEATNDEIESELECWND